MEHGVAGLHAWRAAARRRAEARACGEGVCGQRGLAGGAQHPQRLTRTHPDREATRKPRKEAWRSGHPPTRLARSLALTHARSLASNRIRGLARLLGSRRCEPRRLCVIALQLACDRVPGPS
eukprot:26261-Rhodomonas_salina.3